MPQTFSGASLHAPAQGAATNGASNGTHGEPEPVVEVTVDGEVVVLTIRGCLDDDAGRALLAAAAAAVAEEATRLDIDLRQVQSFTPEGADSLVTCRTLTTGLQEGLHYRTGRGPGRQALLAAYTRRA